MLTLFANEQGSSEIWYKIAKIWKKWHPHRIDLSSWEMFRGWTLNGFLQISAYQIAFSWKCGSWKAWSTCKFCTFAVFVLTLWKISYFLIHFELEKKRVWYFWLSLLVLHSELLSHSVKISYSRFSDLHQASTALHVQIISDHPST